MVLLLKKIPKELKKKKIICSRYPAFLRFAVIDPISMSKFHTIFRSLCKSLEMEFRLYLFEILETQGTAFLFYFQYTCVVTSSLFKMIFVSNKFPGSKSIVNFIWMKVF